MGVALDGGPGPVPPRPAPQGRCKPGRSEKKPWPDWTEWRPNQLWCWDGSQFEQCLAAKYAYAIIDIVSRKWIATILASEQVRVLFLKALDAEGLLTDELADLDDTVPADDLPELPLLLAISDNGTEVRCRDTRRFLAVCSIAQHFGRPSTSTDQAWIETLWGHVKHEHPHLMAITDPAVLASELERVRVEYQRDPASRSHRLRHPRRRTRRPRRRHPQGPPRRARTGRPQAPWHRKNRSQP